MSEIKVSINDRVEWLSKRINLEEHQKDYITFQIKEAVREALEQVKNSDLLHSVSGCFLQNYYYHPENEGTAKTFRNVVTEKWYYESELCDVIGITNVEYLKSNYR